MRKFMQTLCTLAFAIMLPGLVSEVQAAEKKVKVFILAGQSNMEGHGQVRSLDWLGQHPKLGHLLKKLKNADGSWAVRDDVTISYQAEHRKMKTGPLTVGWGCEEHEVGPELMFGTIMGERCEEHVLLIKTAWGGKSVWCDFRSPGAGEMTWDEKRILKRDHWLKPGQFYRKMVAEIKECLANIKDVVPGYKGQGYEIAGMAWFQGWNDFCEWHLQLDGKRVGMGLIKRYPHNLAAMFRDLRKDLDAPDMPIVIGELGVGGHEMTTRAKNLDEHEAVAMVKFRKAQKAVADDPSLKNVTFVPTADFWDTRLQELRRQADAYWNEKQKRKIKDTDDNVLPTKELNDEYSNRGGHWYCHYNGSAANYSLIGYALAEALDTDPDLAMTPPMGWNSWNAFEKEIDEKKIKAIAEAMVSSGMRDAGYMYLVLDDAWMAKKRDKDGRLVAEAKKFPSGMKAIGDYIHSRGLKFGLYEDRGKLTCQQLPGSFGHERIDMETFAQWGVDYIKMDSCFAENNGRMSSEDYALYRKWLKAAGRPMVLSISDFGNGAWAWGGKESAQLWRTSHDIYPWMGSVYACAETSAGDRAIHPAFNGLWQFAGPGHWNDPDMLQVGNLKGMDEDRREIADRAHFSLWCILAAPLMAGNDLRTMSDKVRKVLTAPEVIAVNQDKRGVQGYKVLEDGGCEVYNKPLSDGTTAVLLLNKGDKKADITVRWDKIGLSGAQPVRDLWARKDLGKFKDSFMAHALGQHGHRMIKVGRPGPPLPTAAMMPLEKYTVTRKGATYLSDLYYIWKAGNAPVYNTTYGGEPIRVAGQTFEKGMGCKSKCAVMFKVNGRADRFRAIVAMDKSSKDNANGRFRVYNEDFFANRVLWDSGRMTKETPAKEIDIELNDVQCLMLVFDGKDVLGKWANARVINEAEENAINKNDAKAGIVTAHSRGLHGYIGYSASRPQDRTNYSAGMGFYSAVWPLIAKPIAHFQIGLPSAWITPDNSDNKDTPLAPIGTLARDNWPERGPTWSSVFQTVEGGLGYWARNHFRYGPPKFSMNATPQCYDYEVGSPGWSFFYSSKALPDNRLGIAQLSNRLLIPPDALPFEGNPNGKFLGYTYMALPFTKATTAEPPTGDQAWTCFLSAANFKGPMAYYIPETWSKIGKLFNYPFIYGRGLDARPGRMGGGAMEINTVPCFRSQDSKGVVYSKLPKLQFPVDEQGRTLLVQDVTYYSRAALYDAFKAWRDGGPACSGRFDDSGAWKSTLRTRTPGFDQGGKRITGVDKVFNTKVFESNVWGLEWYDGTTNANGYFPQYFKHVGDKRVAVSAANVPKETQLLTKEFRLAGRGEPYTSPATGAWTKPGPKRGPYTVDLADGSTVTYSWYRFVEQPSFRQYKWSENKRAKLQAFVEKIHASWPMDRDYMAPPSSGSLARLDPALLVTPPEGLEVGYVPIVTRQEDASE